MTTAPTTTSPPAPPSAAAPRSVIRDNFGGILVGFVLLASIGAATTLVALHDLNGDAAVAVISAAVGAALHAAGVSAGGNAG